MRTPLLEALLETFTEGVAHDGLFHPDGIPKVVVTEKLGVIIRRHLYLVDGLLYLRVGEQLARHFARLIVDLGKVTQPKHLHFLLVVRLRGELRQLNEDEAQALDNLVGMFHLYDAVVVVISRQVGLENVVDKAKRIHRLQELVPHVAVKLAHVGL